MLCKTAALVCKRKFSLWESALCIQWWNCFARMPSNLLHSTPADFDCPFNSCFKTHTCSLSDYSISRTKLKRPWTCIMWSFHQCHRPFCTVSRSSQFNQLEMSGLLFVSRSCSIFLWPFSSNQSPNIRDYSEVCRSATHIKKGNQKNNKRAFQLWQQQDHKYQCNRAYEMLTVIAHV